MTTGKFISQLSAQIDKLESLVQSLQNSSFHPSNDQYQILVALSLRLSAAATDLPAQIAALKKRRTEWSCTEGEQLIVQAELEWKDLITTTQLKNRGTFAKNIVLFFKGPSDSVVDSAPTKARKQVTRYRCERICTLSPDALISWAVAFIPTIWTANLMSKDTFDYVLEHIEPDDCDDCRVWPPDIYNILRGLGAEEPLRGSLKYHEFLKAVEEVKETAQSLNRPGKRRRGSDGAALEDESLSSVQTSELVAGNKVVPSPVEESDAAPKAVPGKVMRLIKFDKYILCQILSNLRLDSASTEPINILGKIWFGSLGNRQIVSLRLPSKLGPIAKSSGQVVDIYDTAGTSKSVAPSSLIELERFMQLLHRDGFGDILWNEYGDDGFVTIYVIDPKLIADFRKSGTTQVVSA